MRIWLSRPHMGGDERGLVDEVFDSNFVAPVGPMLGRFEEEFASYLGGGVRCAAVNSGTAALHLALRIVGVGSGDSVWTTSMTFAGGAFPIIYQNAQPTFFDLSPESWTMSPDLLDEALQEAAKTGNLPKALVPTDLYGQSVDLDRFETACERYGVALVLDSAESVGAGYKNRKAGTGGNAAILSFNGNKIITTSGGGMLVSKDQALIDQAKFLSTQAREPFPHYEHETYGYNYRLSNVSAAIGVGQLRVLDERVKRRREINARYRAALDTIDGITFMPQPEWATSSCWLTALTFDPTRCGADRETIRLALLEEEIEARPLWKPMHLQKIFRGAPYVGSGFDESLFENGLCLPSGSDMSNAEQDMVIEVVLHSLSKNA
jgi:pyridoxal phosphate-dependent aminotransferase EpsN